MRVEFCGETTVLGPGDELTFGRDADLVLDESNRFLHRLTGRFVHRTGLWWLQNLGSSVRMEVLDADGPTTILVDPGMERPIIVGQARIRLSAGRTTYELEVDTQAEFVAADPPRAAHADLATTLRAPVIPLNDEQRVLLVALGEPRLRDPHDDRLPANKDIRLRFGWSRKKFDGKLDYLCRRLDEHGVEGLRGDVASLARDRRAVLVDHALATGMISGRDLGLLESAPQVVSAGTDQWTRGA